MNWDLVVILTFVVVMTIARSGTRRRDQLGAGLAPVDQGLLARAQETAQRLEQRVESLERVLDEDAPGWRARVRS